MIKNINKSLENNELTVEVTCKVRDFATKPEKVLTTKELIDILKEEYNIVSVKSQPRYKVGNSNRKKTKPMGKWVFLLSDTKQVEAVVETPPKRTRKPRIKKKETSSTSDPSAIRSRISSLSKK